MVIVLSGPLHSGKSTLLERLSSRWRDRNVRVRGFLSLSLWEGGERNGYDLLDLEKSRALPFLRTAGESGWERVGPFYLVPETLERARAILLAASPGDLLVVDEVGPLELAGGGLRPALDRVLGKPAVTTLLVIREGLLREFLPLLEDQGPVTLDIRDEDIERRLEGLVAGLAVSG
jgi:nucleoside-triphosphatase THEP1